MFSSVFTSLADLDPAATHRRELLADAANFRLARLARAARRRTPTPRTPTAGTSEP